MTSYSFREIYDQYHKMVYNLILQYVQNVEDANEITQDTFVAVHQSFHSFKGQSQLSTWLYRIAINKSLDFIRSRRRKKRFAVFISLFYDNGEEVSHEPAFDHPGVLLEQKEMLQKLFRCINDLPANQKTALILSKIDLKSLKEIAEIMHVSPKAVESLIQRAKIGLEKKLYRNEGN